MCTASLLQEAKKANTMLSSLDIVFTRHLSRSSEWWNLHLPIIIVPAHRSAGSCIYLPLLPGSPAPRWGRWSARPSPNQKKKRKEKPRFCVWGHSWTQFPVWQCNTLTIWVTGPSSTVTSISRSIYQFNSFIFLITKLLSLWACAERLWLLIKMELY